MQDNPLWAYSLAVYDRVGVEPVLLQLQEEFAADINMLLCCCWLAGEGRELTEGDIQVLVRASIKWRAQCIMPLREIRRFLSSQPGSESIRRQVKALELESEQWQQDALFGGISAVSLTVSVLTARELALQHLHTYCGFLPGVEKSDVARLLEALVAAAGLSDSGIV